MTTSLPWLSATTPPALAENELHVWRTSLDLSSAILQKLKNALNAPEKERAERFLVPRAREHFVAARGLLRELLGAYLGINAVDVALIYGGLGKPSLSPPYDSALSFNVSHSRGMGLFVFAIGGEVGVDIEEVRADFKGMEIASRFFPEQEVAALGQLPPLQASTAFFGYWTMKEAYVKAHGQGLSIPLRSFTVKLDQNEQVLRDESGAKWSCYALEPAAGFAGAVVASGVNWELKFLEWSAGAMVPSCIHSSSASNQEE
jgi:4'-phosphopantetheinyl transferase